MGKSYRNIALYAMLLLETFVLGSCATHSALANLADMTQSSVLSAGPVPRDNGAPGADSNQKGTSTAESDMSDKLNQTSEESADSDIVLKGISALDNNANEIGALDVKRNDDLIESEIRRIMLAFGEQDDAPTVFLEEVKGYVRLFQTNQQYRKFVAASLERSARYMTPVKNIFASRGIPEDMAYIAFIESGFNPRALSKAGARGMWQFMVGTARNYGLEVNRKIDERTDPMRSTYAAVDYFHDLIAIFGPRSFLLAIAAYNGGEGKVISCLKGIDDPFEERTFWHIRPCLLPETSEYPPKVIAAAIVGNNPKAFGFPRFETEEDFTKQMQAVYYDPSVRKQGKAEYTDRQPRNISLHATREKSVRQKKPLLYTVKAGNKLDEIAEMFDVDSEDIKKWNKLRDLKLVAGQKIKVYVQNLYEKVSYKVRKGDTISGISNSFKVRPSRIVASNGLKNGWDIRAGQILIFYKPLTDKPIMYTVRNGTTLGHVAKRFRISIRDIMMWNNLSSTALYFGQTLKIYRDVTPSV